MIGGDVKKVDKKKEAQERAKAKTQALRHIEAEIKAMTEQVNSITEQARLFAEGVDEYCEKVRDMDAKDIAVQPRWRQPIGRA